MFGLDVQVAIAIITTVSSLLAGVIAIIKNRQSNLAEERMAKVQSQADKDRADYNERIKKLEADVDEQRSDAKFREKQLDMFREFAGDIKAFTSATMELNKTIAKGNSIRDDFLRTIIANQDAHTIKLGNHEVLIRDVSKAIGRVDATVKSTDAKIDELPHKVDELSATANQSFSDGIKLVTMGLKEIQSTLTEQHTDNKRSNNAQTAAINTLSFRVADLITTLEKLQVPIIVPDDDVEPEKEKTTDGITTE